MGPANCTLKNDTQQTVNVNVYDKFDSLQWGVPLGRPNPRQTHQLSPGDSVKCEAAADFDGLNLGIGNFWIGASNGSTKLVSEILFDSSSERLFPGSGLFLTTEGQRATVQQARSLYKQAESLLKNATEKERRAQQAVHQARQDEEAATKRHADKVRERNQCNAKKTECEQQKKDFQSKKNTCKHKMEALKDDIDVDLELLGEAGLVECSKDKQQILTKYREYQTLQSEVDSLDSTIKYLIRKLVILEEETAEAAAAWLKATKAFQEKQDDHKKKKARLKHAEEEIAKQKQSLADAEAALTRSMQSNS